MRNDVDKPTPEPAVYKAGCRGDKKREVKQSKLKIGTLGLEAIVKLNK